MRSFLSAKYAKYTSAIVLATNSVSTL
jgi:hypothetical protein